MDVREKLVKQAILHFRHGVSHDIFSEPVTTYAKLAIEALIKEIDKGNDCTFEQGADWLIDHGVTAQEWISVKDRLPEDYKQRVMVFCIGDYPIGYPKIDTDRYVHGHWVRYGIYVSHWMPLPQPAKENK